MRRQGPKGAPVMVVEPEVTANEASQAQASAPRARAPPLSRTRAPATLPSAPRSWLLNQRRRRTKCARHKLRHRERELHLHPYRGRKLQRPSLPSQRGQDMPQEGVRARAPSPPHTRELRRRSLLINSSLTPSIRRSDCRLSPSIPGLPSKARPRPCCSATWTPPPSCSHYTQGPSCHHARKGDPREGREKNRTRDDMRI